MNVSLEEIVQLTLEALFEQEFHCLAINKKTGEEFLSGETYSYRDLLPEQYTRELADLVGIKIQNKINSPDNYGI